MLAGINKVLLPPFLLGTVASLYVFTVIISILLGRGSISNQHILQLSSISLSAIALQLIIILIIRKYCRTTIYTNLVAASFFALNLIAFHLLLTPGFPLLHTAIKIATFAGIAAISLLVLAKGHPKVVTWATIIAFAASVFTATSIGKDILNTNQAALPKNYLSNLEPLRLKRKPNLYLLSFDGLIDQDMLDFHFPDRDIKSDYTRTLEELGAQIIPNSVADSGTLITFNLMLAMDYPWWRDLPSELHRQRLLTGVQNSQIYDILRKNGYSISLLHVNDYLSRAEKTNIDFHYKEHFNICDGRGELSNFAFWGYCPIFAAEHYDLRGLDFMDSKLQQLVTSPREHKFVIAYWLIPGHTYRLYNWHDEERRNSFKKHFFDNFEAVSAVMKRNVNFIRSHDPEAIILIFGDHGVGITKGTKPEDGIFTKEQLRRDINGIILAAINHGGCQLQSADGETYIGHALLNLILCLYH